jgi:sulfonate transport system substrate-binding protein
MNRIKQILVTTLTTLVFAIGISANAHAEDKPAVIRIGYPGAGTAGRPLGQDLLGYIQRSGAIEDEFRADGIKVQWNFYPGAGPAVNEAHANGLLDFAGHGDLPLLVGRSTGLKRHIIAAYSRLSSTYFVVPSSSSARTLADLKGKRIATFKGTAGQLTLNRVFARYGFSEKDFKVINADTDTTKAGLATGDIDGAIISPYDLEARGVARRILEITSDPEISSPSSFWVDDAFEKKYPQIVQRVVNAYVRAAAKAVDESNRDRIFHQWAEAGNTSYIDFVKDWQGFKLKERANPLLDDYYYAAIRKSYDESKRFKLLRRDIDIDEYIEPKYLNAALKTEKLENVWTPLDAKGKPKS